ncbi:unnamed protein product [Cochlearia groenlandica]
MVKVMWVSGLALVMCVSLLAFTAALLLMTLAEIPVVEGVTCSPSELSPCAAALTSSSPPSGLCCSKLREQKPCFCGYLRNPNLRQYYNSPNAKKVSNICKIPLPKC